MNKLVVATIIVVIVLIGGYFAYQAINSPAPTSDTQSQSTPSATTNNEPDTGAQSTVPTTTVNHDITYTDAGFSPSTLTIKAGETVTFKNQSTHGMWIGSANHPSHAVYSGTTLQEHCKDTQNNAFDQCQSNNPGESWSFTFTKVGSWGYHNHVKATDVGKIVVQ